MNEIEHVQSLQDHWWWRPGWHAGRHFYAVHFTFEDQPSVQKLVATYQSALDGIQGLDMIPQQWLHMTMQGIGFIDELSHEEVRRITEIVGQEVASLQAPAVTFHRPVIRPEAVYLPCVPPEPIRTTRIAVRRAIAAVLGKDRLSGMGEYRPHVSIAYSNSTQPASPIVAALTSVSAQPTVVTLNHVALLSFHRDRGMYEWTDAEPFAFRSTPQIT